MNIRKTIINWLLKPDEEITTKSEPDESNPIVEPKKTKKIAPIIYGTDVHKGVIKKRKNGYWVYWYDGKIPRQKKGEFEHLKKQLDKFQEEGCTLESWNENFYQNPDRRKKKTPTNYIYDNRGNFTIRKYIKGTQYTWGSYSSRDKAQIVRDYLDYKKWDLTYLPSNLVGSKKMKVDEYYLNILPFIYGDTEYEKFKGGTLNDAY